MQPCRSEAAAPRRSHRTQGWDNPAALGVWAGGTLREQQDFSALGALPEPLLLTQAVPRVMQVLPLCSEHKLSLGGAQGAAQGG